MPPRLTDLTVTQTSILLQREVTGDSSRDGKLHQSRHLKAMTRGVFCPYLPRFDDRNVSQYSASKPVAAIEEHPSAFSRVMDVGGRDSRLQTIAGRVRCDGIVTMGHTFQYDSLL